MAEIPLRHRPGPPGLHRRNLDQDQHGAVAGLGADCVEKELRAEHIEQLAGLLARAGVDAEPTQFRRYGSARRLYNFHVDNLGSY